MVALIFNSLPVPFGAVGTPITGGAMKTLEGSIHAANIDPEVFRLMLTQWVAIPNAIIGILLPLLGIAIMCKFFGKERSIKPALEVAPFALFAGIVFAVPYVIIATTLGPDLPSLLGAFIGLGIVIAAAKNGFLMPKKSWDFPSKDEWEENWKSGEDTGDVGEAKMGLVRAWMPYVLIALILVVTRIPSLGLKDILSSQSLSWNNVLGIENLNYALKWAYLPGTIPFILVAIITNFMHGMSPGKVAESWKLTFKQITGAAIALFAGVGMVQLMLQTGNNPAGLPSMLTTMAQAAADLTGKAYPLIITPIGMLGAFMSGSATVSNLLFASLQFQTANILGLPEVIVVAMQTIGAAVGNMICVNNVVAVCATVGCIGAEGLIIRRNAIPAFLYYVAVTIVGLILIFVMGINPIPIAPIQW